MNKWTLFADALPQVGQIIQADDMDIILDPCMGGGVGEPHDPTPLHVTDVRTDGVIIGEYPPPCDDWDGLGDAWVDPSDLVGLAWRPHPDPKSINWMLPYGGV